MKSYRVGRGRDADIVVSDETVGRLHAELAECPDGRFLVRDLRSTNGTFVQAGGGWQRLESGYVQADHRLRLGNFETTARQLMALAARPAEPASSPASTASPAKRRPERNPLTGEIVERKR